MLKDEISRRIKQAMRDGNTVEKEVLRVALGDIQTAEAREGAKESDDAAIAVVKKLLKSVTETAAQTANPAEKATLEAEIVVLSSLLPKALSVEELVAKLAPKADAIKAAPNDGAATGIAMKALKADGVDANGKDVTEAVKKLRG
ncbi:MAG: GatB/YqeY domain-containing protein [Myxococcales bacterium]|nr:GatB/YqeY domain-containing protein [Myxococcales bacterium]